MPQTFSSNKLPEHYSFIVHYTIKQKLHAHTYRVIINISNIVGVENQINFGCAASLVTDRLVSHVGGGNGGSFYRRKSVMSCGNVCI
jgi:hypothetical protein